MEKYLSSTRNAFNQAQFSRQTNPFKQDDDNDPTRIRPAKKKTDKPQPERTSPPGPGEEKEPAQLAQFIR